MSYGKVYEVFWEDEKIEGLSDRATLMALFLISGPHRNAIGCFRLGTGAISDYPRFGGWGIEGISDALSELREMGFLVRDDRTGWTLIANSLKHDPIRGSKAAIHALGLLQRVPKNTLVYQELVARLKPQLDAEAKALQGKPGYPIEGVSEGHAMPKPSPLPLPEPSPLPEPDNPSSLRSEGFVAADATTPPDDDPADSSAAEVREAVDAYNHVAEAVGLPRVQKLTGDRRTKLRARLKDAGGIDGWRAALEKLAASPHCRGENNRGWRADFDFLVSESKFTRLMEGRYDSHGPPASSSRGGIVQAAEMAKEMMRREAEQWEH